ncbi:MAG: DUF1385 domain-containing protein [Clostridia bacterium]|nr:DUF1385 domain-containing protein [Clostridia bacterium]
MEEKKITSIGGQAVLEGVMMRGPHKMAIAVRKPDGEIVMDEKPVKKHPVIGKLPLVRGVFSFFSSLIIGVQAITFSAKFFEDEEENNKSDKEKESSDGTLPNWAIAVSVAIALLLSVGLFVILPNFLSNIVVAEKEENALLYNVIESFLKIGIFLAYIIAVSQMKDMKRVFEYHGAEHKTIFCYENGEELTVENVKKYTRFHPRCGTSFLLFVVIISIIVHMFLGVYENGWINAGLRLLCLPLIAGISYEIIKFAGKSKSKCVTWLNAPGKWLQRFTTREPDDKQIEVAIASLKAVIPENSEDDKW